MRMHDLFQWVKKDLGIGLTERQKLAIKIKAARRTLESYKFARSLVCKNRFNPEHKPKNNWEVEKIRYWDTEIMKQEAQIRRMCPRKRLLPRLGR